MILSGRHCLVESDPGRALHINQPCTCLSNYGNERHRDIAMPTCIISLVLTLGLYAFGSAGAPCAFWNCSHTHAASAA